MCRTFHLLYHTCYTLFKSRFVVFCFLKGYGELSVLFTEKQSLRNGDDSISNSYIISIFQTESTVKTQKSDFLHLDLRHFWSLAFNEWLRHQNRVSTMSECRRFQHQFLKSSSAYKNKHRHCGPIPEHGIATTALVASSVQNNHICLVGAPWEKSWTLAAGWLLIYVFLAHILHDFFFVCNHILWYAHLNLRIYFKFQWYTRCVFFFIVLMSELEQN